MRSLPRLVVAGVSSGVGKTSITCAIIRVMRRRGLAVSPFKVGPDYVDPVYLGAAAGREARNLDVWVMGGAGRALEGFVRNSPDPSVSVIEGVMGYYDGHSGSSDYASTYQMAGITRSPVILVADASKAARSVAATIRGFRTFQKNSRIAGVILNKLGSISHELTCRDALRGEGVPVLGAICRDASMTLEERHLGLYSTVDRAELEEKVERIADVVEPQLDVRRLLTIAYSAGPPPAAPRPRRVTGAVQQNRRLVADSRGVVGARGVGGKGPVIAVAHDSSFNFYYQDNLDALRREGASLAFFSPVSDRRPPACDALYIGGGFPEVLAAPLEQNLSMKKSIKGMAEDGMPVYAECGGMMYLSKSITSGSKRHEMVGLFDTRVEMTGRPAIAYTEGIVESGTPITGESDRKFRGHEFHYSRVPDVPRGTRLGIYLYENEEYDDPDDRGLFRGYDGLMAHNTLAAYGHIYFDVADFASHFVANSVRYRRR